MSISQGDACVIVRMVGICYQRSNWTYQAGDVEVRFAHDECYSFSMTLPVRLVGPTWELCLGDLGTYKWWETCSCRGDEAAMQRDLLLIKLMG